jgi:hypothetical protein
VIIATVYHWKRLFLDYVAEGDCEIVILPRTQFPRPTARLVEAEPIPIVYFRHNRDMTILSKPSST